METVADKQQVIENASLLVTHIFEALIDSRGRDHNLGLWKLLQESMVMNFKETESHKEAMTLVCDICESISFHNGVSHFWSELDTTIRNRRLLADGIDKALSDCYSDNNNYYEVTMHVDDKLNEFEYLAWFVDEDSINWPEGRLNDVDNISFYLHTILDSLKHLERMAN